MSPEKKATINAFGKSIAKTLSDIREQTGVTQAQLATATGISQSQLSKQLRGIRAINMDELDAICKALGTSMIDVIRGVEALVDELQARRRSKAPREDVPLDSYDLPMAANHAPEEQEGAPGDYEA